MVGMRASPADLTLHVLPSLASLPRESASEATYGIPCRSRSVYPACQALWVVNLERLEFGLGKICNPGPWPPPL